MNCSYLSSFLLLTLFTYNLLAEDTEEVMNINANKQTKTKKKEEKSLPITEQVEYVLRVE